jgi:hypothetical protein
MTTLVDLVEEALSGGNDVLEREIFGTNEPSVIGALLEEYVTTIFSEEIRPLFYRHSVGVVGGVAVGSRRVVVKVHHWRASLERLAGLQLVQSHFAAQGLAAPRPLHTPQRLGSGLVTVEEYLAGSVANGHDQETRRALAGELHRFIRCGATLSSTKGLDTPALLETSNGQLWPEPHSPRFNFAATSEGARWIDELACSARRRLEGLGSDVVVGHLDWRVQNVGFEGARLTAIYDWDSVGLATEAFIVGSAAATFTSDWSKPGGSLPRLDEMSAFVDEYQRAAGRAFDAHEREILDAANLLLVAYGARCQHSDSSLVTNSFSDEAPSWKELLSERGERALCT